MKETQNECYRCGICCEKGGPALHTQDLALIKSGKIPRASLITIGKGELVYKFAGDKPLAASCELIKISGTGRQWQCFYFNSHDKGCRIYINRPIACSTLQCWNTSAIEKLVETDTITRFDIIEKNDPMVAILEDHGGNCPCPDLLAVIIAIESHSYPAIQSFEDLVNMDMKIRGRVVKKYNYSLADELFFFGRPIFQQLQQLGVLVSESGGKLRLRWPTS